MGDDNIRVTAKRREHVDVGKLVTGLMLLIEQIEAEEQADRTQSPTTGESAA